MLSVGYGQSGNDSAAIQEAQAFLTFTQKTQNPVWQKFANALLGDLHQKFGRPSNAFTDTNRSVTVPLGGAKETFRGLKYAGTEVDSIAAEIPGSTKLVNNQFNQDIV